MVMIECFSDERINDRYDNSNHFDPIVDSWSRMKV